MPEGTPLEVRVTKVADETARIRSFELRRLDEGRLPDFEPGAHVVVRLADGMARQYSLAGDDRDHHSYLIAVLREEAGRGGSLWMHQRVREGDTLRIEGPFNMFPLASEAKRHLFIAGGIGITPILAMARKLTRMGADYEVVYCTRDLGSTAFRDLLLAPPLCRHVRLVHDGGVPARGLDIMREIDAASPDTHMYCCGPAGMIRAFKTATQARKRGFVHSESFTGGPVAGSSGANDRAFAVVIASSGVRLEIPADGTMLATLTRHGIEVQRLCEAGYCGSCLTRVLSGTPDHRDTVQSDAEKAGAGLVALCCSRASSDVLVLDL